MRMIVCSLIALVLLVAALYGWGLTLQEGHIAVVSREIRIAPDAVFARLITFEEHPKWRSDLQSVTYNRLEQRIVVKNGSEEMTYRITKLEAPRTLVTEIEGGRELGFGGTWTFELEPAGSGTKVTITERGQVYSPMFRVMGKLFFSPENSATQYLVDLAKSFEK